MITLRKDGARDARGVSARHESLPVEAGCLIRLYRLPRIYQIKILTEALLYASVINKTPTRFFVSGPSLALQLPMRTTVSPILFALSGAVSVAAGVHEVWWNLSYAYDVSPDGLGVPRRAIGVNGTWPSVFSFFASSVPSQTLD